MTVNRFQTNYNVRSDLNDRVTPSPILQNDVAIPMGPGGLWKPAPWLPIVFTKTGQPQGTDYFVISSGKVVALAGQDAYVVPAGLRARWAVTGATTVLTYTATDYAQGVVNLITGARYAVNGTTNYTALDVAKALIERGLVAEDTVSNNPPSSDNDIAAIVRAFISLPRGIVYGDVYKWAGTPEAGDQYFTNYNKQHGIQIITEQQMRVPYRVANLSAGDAYDVSVLVPVTNGATAGDFPQPGEVWAAAALASCARYGIASTQKVVGLALTYKPVAKNVVGRTPVTCDIATVLVSEKTSLALVKNEGDWFLDQDVGVLFISSDTYADLVAADTDPTIVYYYYDDSNTGTTTDRFIYFDGECRPGDFVSFDDHSNFVLMAGSGDALGGSNAQSLARVDFIDTEPKDLLEYVKTSTIGGGTPPGSATNGYSDLIVMASEAGEPVSNRCVVLSVRI